MRYLAFLLALLWTVPAAGQTFVNSTTGADVSGSVLTTQATSSFSVTTGNHIVVGVRWGAYVGSGDPAVTDTAGNTYTATSCGTVTGPSGDGSLRVFYAENITGHANNVVTATWSGGTEVWYTSVIALQRSGLAASGSVDVCAESVDDTTPTCTTASFSTTNANDEIVTFVEHSMVWGSWTAGNGATERTEDAYGVQAVQTQSVSTIQSSITRTMTSSDTNGIACAALAVAFKTTVSTISYINGGVGTDYSGNNHMSIGTASFNLAAQNHVTVMVRWFPVDSGDPVVTDTAGNTYNGITGCPAFVNSGGTWVKPFFAQNTQAHATNVVTASWSGNVLYSGVSAVQHSGVAGSSPLNTCVYATGTTPTLTSPSFTTTAQNAVIVTLANQDDAFQAWSAGTGAGTIRVQDAFNAVGIASNIVSAIQTNVTSAMTSTGTGVVGQIVAVVFAEGVAAPSSHGHAMLWGIR